MTRILLLFLLLSACVGKNDSNSTSSNLEKGQKTIYNLEAPDNIFNLTNSLREISGLSCQSDQTLIAVNDELGKIYHLDSENGSLRFDTKFHKAGDYEGIAHTPDGDYVIKSNGHMYEIKSNKKTKSITTALASKNDVEGLCYDKANNQLLIACKGNPYIQGKGHYIHKRAIYKYDLEEKKLLTEDFILISNDDLLSWFEKLGDFESLDNITKMRLQSRIQRFSPSGIDIHPITNSIYILSARGKLLVVISPDGTFEQLHLLDEIQHNQPEGLCFSDQGVLFISNEGKHVTPKIYKYNLKS